MKQRKNISVNWKRGTFSYPIPTGLFLTAAAIGTVILLIILR